MKTFKDIIKQWPTLADFASDIGVSVNTAKQMQTRQSVNGMYWRRMLNGAASRGLSVTLDDLSKAYAARPKQTVKKLEAAE